MRVPRIVPIRNYNTHVFIDFDDTILPTSYLDLMQLSLRSKPQATYASELQLQAVASSVTAMLSEILRFSAVTIITLAEAGWVQLAAACFIPSTIPVLLQCNIVSARALFAQTCQNDWVKCKREAFLRVITDRSSPSKSPVMNLVCIGDSHIEMNAFADIPKQLPGALTKAVKLLESPTPAQLSAQHRMLTGHFKRIVCCTERIETQFLHENAAEDVTLVHSEATHTRACTQHDRAEATP
jgi:hypothetical protein